MADQKKSCTALWGVVFAGVIVACIAVPFSSKPIKAAPVDLSPEAADQRIQPVAKLALQAPGAAGGKAKSGSEVYQTVCAGCHGVGAAGAPKSGDKAAWGPRIAQGKPALYNSALNGKNAMPPRGGNADLSDAEVKAAVDHLVGLAK